MARLTFEWPHDPQPYSFDLGGVLTGGEFHQQHFLVECKKWNTDGPQGGHYLDFLAKCYLTRRAHARAADHFMWITWHPFRQTTWTRLCDAETIREGLMHQRNRARALGHEDETQAKDAIDEDVAEDVAQRLWIIVLSDKQEDLVITRDDLSLVVRERVRTGQM